MAEEKLPNPAEDDDDAEWKRVTEGYERGDALKEGPYVNISKNGAVEAGAEATALVLAIAAELGYKLYDFALDIYASGKKGQLACVPISLEEATSGSVAVRWYTGKGSPRAAWHVGGAFKENRALRPKANIRCMVTRGTGRGGVPALIIPLKAHLSKQSVSREGGESTPGSQAAASDDPNA